MMYKFHQYFNDLIGYDLPLGFPIYQLINTNICTPNETLRLKGKSFTELESQSITKIRIPVTSETGPMLILTLKFNDKILSVNCLSWSWKKIWPTESHDMKRFLYVIEKSNKGSRFLRKWFQNVSDGVSHTSELFEKKNATVRSWNGPNIWTKRKEKRSPSFAIYITKFSTREMNY